jgi:hypothetical protein
LGFNNMLSFIMQNKILSTKKKARDRGWIN